MDNNEIVLFETNDNEITLNVPIENETVWLSQAQMSELFRRDVSVISRHIRKIFSEEVEKESNLHFLQIANSWCLSVNKPLVLPVVDKNALAYKRKPPKINDESLATASLNQRRFRTMKNEIKHTAHSSYRCEYHIVFAPKYRRKQIYGQLKKDVGAVIRKLCNEMKVEIIEAEACPDHIHLLVSIPPYMSVSQFVGTLKSKSALMIFDRHAHLKYKYGNRNFWCRGYYVDTVGRNEKKIKEYIRNQLEEDYTKDQMSIKEFMDPFTGEKKY